jgi:predicted RNA-binding protein YlxR (DUF448 family)
MNEAQVQAIVDAALAAAAAAAPAIGVPAPPLPYARTPAQAKVGVLNYGSNEGMKIYNAAVAALTPKYDGNALGLHIFLKKVKERGHDFGWRAILDIPKADGTIKNLIDQYGLIELEEIQAHAMIYENEGGRNGQNASQMYTFLFESLTDEAKLMVLSDAEDYTIDTDGTTSISNGPCFLKVIIRNTTVDTRSTIFHIRENLNHLEAKILEVSYDIEVFNLYVTSQIEQLAARGESSSDILINVFTAYLAVPDKKFVEYVEKQKDRFDEGEDITYKKLMQVALIKFKDRKRSDKWQAPSAEEEQILALTAQIGDLKKEKSALADKAKKGGSKNKQGDGKKAKEAAKMAERYAWKLVPPETGEPRTKEVNGKTYHFCMHHNDGKGAWVIHHPDKCDKRETKNQKGKSAAEKKVMSLTKALKAIHEEDDDDVASSEDEEE